MHRKWCVALSVVFTGILSLDCRNKDAVSLRPLPYPYKAALAICSDIDGTESFDRFLDVQRFLDTSDSTVMGRGLDLEIGNSFWFYNQCEEVAGTGSADSAALGKQISGGLSFEKTLYIGRSETLAPCAPAMEQLIRSGYLDCLHSYGNFAEGGFSRALAERAVAFMKRESLTVRTWVNHGGHENTQNVGDAPWFRGDNREAPEYHTDLTIPMGIRFVWRGQVTHCIGQDGSLSIINSVKQLYEYLQDKLRSHQCYPHDNRLVHPYRLDDGRWVFEFVRFISPMGSYPEASETHFADQLGPKQVDQLISNRGYLIMYTHLGLGDGSGYLNPRTVGALRYIKARCDERSLLVTTTSKLLSYYIARHCLFWHSDETIDKVTIVIDSISNTVDGKIVPTLDDLGGITFYIPDQKNVEIQVSGATVSTITNPADENNLPSVTIPWRKLQFPENLRTQPETH